MPIPMGFRRLAEHLRARIDAGEFTPGSRMPTYRQLAEQYGVGITTMQKAVGLLQEEGVIVGVQGLGLYVAEKKT